MVQLLKTKQQIVVWDESERKTGKSMFFLLFFPISFTKEQAVFKDIQNNYQLMSTFLEESV